MRHIPNTEDTAANTPQMTAEHHMCLLNVQVLSHLVICIARNVVLVLDIQDHVECVQLFLRNAVLIGAQ